MVFYKTILHLPLRWLVRPLYVLYCVVAMAGTSTDSRNELTVSPISIPCQTEFWKHVNCNCKKRLVKRELEQSNN